jgi:diphthamide synthase (EF-2-diphthine--ammonia ligase)
MQAVASWSGGKDSCLACYKVISEGVEISHLLNLISADANAEEDKILFMHYA